MRLGAIERIHDALEPVVSVLPVLGRALHTLERDGPDGIQEFVATAAQLDWPSALTHTLPVDRTDRVLIGAGFAATLRYACLSPAERRRTVVIAADHEPWLDRGSLRMGQPTHDLACPTLPIDVVDLTPPSERPRFCPAKTFGVALRLSQLSIGMRFCSGTLEAVDIEDGEMRLVLRGPRIVHTASLELALGTGPPRRMDARVVPDHDEMRLSGALLYAEEAMRQATQLRGKVAIGSAGLSAAWVAEKALLDGCEEVSLFGSGHARHPGDSRLAAAESAAQLELIRRTTRTSFLLHAAGEPPPDVHGARLRRDERGKWWAEYLTRGYLCVRSRGPKAGVELDDGSILEFDRFVSAAGQDDGWRRHDAPAQVERPPMGALGLRTWALTAAHDGAPVGLNDAEERCRAFGAAGSRGSTFIGSRPSRSPRTRETDRVLKALICRETISVHGDTPDGVPYQSLAVLAHYPTPTGPLAPDGLALANLGTIASLRQALPNEGEARAVLATRDRLMAYATSEEEADDAFTESEDDGLLPPGWWALEDFLAAGLGKDVVLQLSSFEPTRSL